MLKAQVAMLTHEDARHSTRRRANFAAFVRDATSSGADVRVSDLSEEGCRISPAAGLERGSRIWLKILGHMPQRALVAWVREDDAGCEFCTPLGSDVIEELLSVARSSRPEWGSERNTAAGE